MTERQKELLRIYKKEEPKDKFGRPLVPIEKVSGTRTPTPLEIARQIATNSKK